jgi:hypothetical protein
MERRLLHVSDHSNTPEYDGDLVQVRREANSCERLQSSINPCSSMGYQHCEYHGGQETYVEPDPPSDIQQTRSLFITPIIVISRSAASGSPVIRSSNLLPYSCGTQMLAGFDLDVVLVRNNYGSASMLSLPF